MAADGFEELYDRELSYVWRTLGRFGVPASDLADAAHDVFVVVWQHLAELDADRPVRPWLFGVARRVAAGRRRKQGESLEPVREQAAPDRADPERDLLWRALAELDEDRRVVVILHDLEGCTGAEIAERLRISANTVHSRLRLARAQLVELVKKLGGAR